MTEQTPQESTEIDSDDRRSLLKKGALATGALALGLGSAGSASAQGRNVLVYTYDYHPNVEFRVTHSLRKPRRSDYSSDRVGEQFPKSASQTITMATSSATSSEGAVARGRFPRSYSYKAVH